MDVTDRLSEHHAVWKPVREFDREWKDVLAWDRAQRAWIPLRNGECQSDNLLASGFEFAEMRLFDTQKLDSQGGGRERRHAVSRLEDDEFYNSKEFSTSIPTNFLVVKLDLNLSARTNDTVRVKHTHAADDLILV